MQIIADLQIHSKYARATSPQINIENLEKYARIKGLHLLGTGDFQHPLWFKDLDKLEEDENGILWTKSKFPFLWQTEVSLMYSQGGKGRRVHHVILAPNKEVVKQIIEGTILTVGGLVGINQAWKLNEKRRQARKFLTKLERI